MREEQIPGIIEHPSGLTKSQCWVKEGDPVCFKCSHDRQECVRVARRTSANDAHARATQGVLPPQSTQRALQDPTPIG